MTVKQDEQFGLFCCCLLALVMLATGIYNAVAAKNCVSGRDKKNRACKKTNFAIYASGAFTVCLVTCIFTIWGTRKVMSGQSLD
jgi:hypothetical protein